MEHKVHTHVQLGAIALQNLMEVPEASGILRTLRLICCWDVSYTSCLCSTSV
jgi:hypothetical protein